MSVKSPLCGFDGCRNPTWDGHCYLHVNGSNGSTNTGSIIAPSIFIRIPLSSMAEAWSDSSSVFTDIDDVVGVMSVRNQVRATVTAAVSLEAYRSFRYIDVANPNQRNTMAAGLRFTITERLRPESATFGKDDAIDLVNSSSDEFGRSAEDSAGLIGYGLIKEWQIGQYIGDNAMAPDGTPYSNNLDDFITVVFTGELEQLIKTQFGHELSRFDQIIKETTGNHAKNQSSLHESLVISDTDDSVQSQYYTEQYVRDEANKRRDDMDRVQAEAQKLTLQQAEKMRQAKDQARHERNKRVLGTIGLTAAAIALDLDGSRAQQKARKVQNNRNKEWDHLRESMQRETDEKSRRQRRN